MHRCLFCPQSGDWELSLNESGPSLPICVQHFFPYLVLVLFVAGGGKAPLVKGPRISHDAVIENARRWARHFLGITQDQHHEQNAAVDEVERLLKESDLEPVQTYGLGELDEARRFAESILAEARQAKVEPGEFDSDHPAPGERARREFRQFLRKAGAVYGTNEDVESLIAQAEAQH
ncbi:MAG: hypothetical protein WD557_01325 [Dehalococcoidia bacterium]